MSFMVTVTTAGNLIEVDSIQSTTRVLNAFFIRKSAFLLACMIGCDSIPESYQSPQGPVTE